MRSKTKRLVRGVGINDADYVTTITSYTRNSNGKRIAKNEWRCPFYEVWGAMLARCFSKRLQQKYPTYQECILFEDWKYFSKFKSWMETQDWQGKQLDKDILVKGNKLYSPETCVFVTRKVNTFMTEADSIRGKFLIGVYFNKDRKKYISMISESNKSVNLGSYDREEDAHLAYCKRKFENSKLLIKEENVDDKVAKAIISRYETQLNEAIKLAQHNNS